MEEGPDKAEAKSSNQLVFEAAGLLPFLLLGVLNAFFDILIENAVNVDYKALEVSKISF